MTYKNEKAIIRLSEVLMREKNSNNEVTVYSCSGCSNVAQLANSVAIELHRSGKAQMSCIAGVGGDVDSLVKRAKSSDKIIALDGCPLACTANCLKRHGVNADVHLILTKLGLVKKISEEVSKEIKDQVYEKTCEIVDELKRSR